jgi:RNA polymerase sigma-70 factor, ECF subfamily
MRGSDHESTKLSHSDEILVKRCKKGDKKAFELLVEKYQRRIFHLIYRITQDSALVEPLAQEAFFKAYRAIDSFKGDSQFYTWLYRIAVNTCLSHIKKEFPEDSLGNAVEAESRLYAGDLARFFQNSPEQDYMRKEFLTQLVEHLRKLPEELRTSIMLREFMELNYEEIAEVLDIPLGTVRSRIFRAREKLRESLAPFFDL